MKDYFSKIQQNDEELKKMTGLKTVEFEGLHKSFEKLWSAYFGQYTFDGKPRLRQPATRKNSIFGETREALLFGLIYLRNDLLQEELATQCGMDQPKASRYLFLIRKLLKESVTKNAKILPRRKREWLRSELQS
jgi:hypothetical protein